MTTKTCHKCKRILPLEDFYRAKSSKDGYAPSCKDCQWGSPLGTRTSPSPKINTHGLIPTEVPHGSNIKCAVKAEKDTKKVFQKAKKIVESNDEPTIINSDKVFVVPKREDYHGSFDWDQVYGKKCSICHQKYKEEDRYMVVGMHLDTIVTRHEVCG